MLFDIWEPSNTDSVRYGIEDIVFSELTLNVIMMMMII